MSKLEFLKNTIASLPELPGIYKYFNKEEQIIYVGKAKNIKKRVSSYFTKNDQSFKTRRLVSQITRIEFAVVDNERDALLLENNLIKKHQPRYNILLKDGKSYPFICISNERFPRIFVTRRKIASQGTYYGPYTNVSAMTDILELIKKIYSIRTCNFNLSQESIEGHRYKVCLDFHIGICKGPCESHQTEDDYMAEIQEIRNVLQGKISIVKESLKIKMQEYAQEMLFEKAQIYKNHIENLESFRIKNSVISNSSQMELEVYTLISNEETVYLNYLQIIEGSIVRTHTTEVKKILDETDGHILSIFINFTQSEYDSSIVEIISNIQPDELPFGVKCTVPERGEKRNLVELSIKNSLEYKRQRLEYLNTAQKNAKEKRILERLQADLGLTTLPKHIECFDNSNIQGTDPVAGMVCFKDGKPSKKDYRHFKIKTVIGADDFASMFEIVTRRYKRLKEEEQALPDLIIIDGGKGQLNAACDALKELNLYGKIAIVSIAKRLEEIFVPNDQFALHLDKKSESLLFLQRIRDEVHHFAISFHRDVRSSNRQTNKLEEIKGLGKDTIVLLYKEFKTFDAIIKANEAILLEMIGKKKTQLIQNYKKNILNEHE